MDPFKLAQICAKSPPIAKNHIQSLKILCYCERWRTWKITKKFEDAELQTILDADDTLSQEQLTVMLNVVQQTIFDRLKAMENPKVLKMSATWI